MARDRYDVDYFMQFKNTYTQFLTILRRIYIKISCQRQQMRVYDGQPVNVLKQNIY